MIRLAAYVPLGVILLCGTVLVQLGHAQAPDVDPERLSSKLDSLRQQIEAKELSGYAPTQVNEALQAYEAAKAALRQTEDPEAVRERVRAARQALNEAIQTARISKSILAEVDAAREQLQHVPIFEANREALEEGGEKYKSALSQVDEGDLEDAREEANEAIAAYREAARIALLEKDLPEARAQVEAAEDEGRIPEPTYEALLNRLDQLKENIEDAEGESYGVASFYRRYHRRIQDEIIIIYPDFYRDPPDTLLVGDFTLVVDSFRTRGAWDFDRNQMVNAAGVAWVSFACRRPLRIAPGQIPVRTFEVVEEVTNPERQISLERARKMEKAAELGEQIRLAVPNADTLGRFLDPENLPQNVLQPPTPPDTGPSAPPGGIRLAFDNARIEPTGRPQVGRVLAGQSRYPTQPPSPKDATLSIEGFTAHLDRITLTPSRSTATIELEFPTSIRDSTGRRARYSLGTLPITPDCAFHATHPDSTYGPWTVGGTGIEVKGKGIVADFSEQWTWSGVSSSQVDDWRGVILKSGRTVAAADTVRSDTGYLEAKYTFADATVTEPGLQTTMSLSERFVFETLQPAGYLVELRRGGLQIDSSAVTGGGFPEGDVRLPPTVVRNAASSDPIEASFASQLLVQRDLDLFGPLSLTQPLQWQRPLQSSSGRFEPHYSVTNARGTFFFLSGTVRPEYRPSRQDQFRHPQLSGAGRREVRKRAETRGIQGLIVSRPGMATIHSPDAARPLTIPVDSGWVHVGGRGVNGMMVLRRDTPLNPQLGVPGRSRYEAPRPFDFTMQRPTSGRPTTVELQFSDGALFESNGEGQIALGKAVQDSMAVRDVAITSTAQIPAVELDTTSHTVTLSYWGLDLVTQENMRSPGVASVKTGVVYLTGAGLAEPRHFAEPFDLIWGEILADGRFKTKDLKMDLNARGQKMDHFPFTPTTLNLSPYRSGGDPNRAYMQVGGTLHFALFGTQHLHVIDRNNPDSTQSPYKGRFLALADSTGRGAIAPTNRAVQGSWGNGFAQMNYTLGYNTSLQNGFSGPGSVAFSLLFPSGLTSGLRARNGRLCMNVREMNRTDFRLGPVAHFGKATEITGCACIDQHTAELQQLALSASLAQARNLNVALRSARHGHLEFLHSPTVTEATLDGHYSLGTIISDLVINGSARFTVNHAKDFVDGTLTGSFNTEVGTVIGGSSMQASGTLDWHLGAGIGGKHYQHLQGRVQTDMMGGNVLASAHAGAEGGFYVGINAPKSEAWVIQNADSRARVDMTPFPARLTGVYGYLQVSMGLNTILVGGGVESMMGLGLFGLTANQFQNLNAQANPVQLAAQGATGTLIPYGVGKMWVHVWGEILKGALRAEGTTNLMLIGPRPFGFKGELTLGGCVGWVLCGEVTLGCGLHTARNGFYVDTK